MGKTATKMPNFCLNRIRPLIRVRSPPIQSKTNEISEEKSDDSVVDVEKEEYSGGGAEKSGAKSRRKIMIVVDSTPESKTAVQWALTHTVQNQDLLILLYVTKPSKKGEYQSSTTKVLPEFLTCMKSSCKLKRPEVFVEAAVVEAGKLDKGAAIVEAAKKHGAAMLVVGQKKRSVTWRLMLMWAGNRAADGGGVAEYCVQNASCMAVAVRRKSKKLGGYLITTKRQKDFWLLA